MQAKLNKKIKKLVDLVKRQPISHDRNDTGFSRRNTTGNYTLVFTYKNYMNISLSR